MVVIFSLDEIRQVAKQMLDQAGDSRVWAFHGSMGAGKTTLIEAICREAGVEDVMSSPTFSIINEYRTRQGRTVYHMDLYRLSGEEEAIRAGVEECLYSGDLCLVEWPEKAPGIFPAGTFHCHISPEAEGKRKLEFFP